MVILFEKKGDDSQYFGHNVSNGGKLWFQEQTTASKTQEALNFEEVTERSTGLPYHKVNYTAGKDLRDRANRVMLGGCVKSKNYSNWCYANIQTRNRFHVGKKWTSVDNNT